MYTSPWVHLANLLFQDLSSVNGRACGGHTRDENLRTNGLEGVLDTAPMRDLQRGNRRTKGHGVKTQQPVTEDHWILRIRIYMILASSDEQLCQYTQRCLMFSA